MKFEKMYASAVYNAEGMVTDTNIAIRSGEMNFLLLQVAGDHRHRSDDELVRLALEEFYQTVYPSRAEKEGIAAARTAAEEAKQKAEEAMPVLVNGNTFATMIAGEMIANDRNLWPEQYKGLLEFIPEAVPGQKYQNGQYVKVKDTKLAEDTATGQYVCVRLGKGDDWVYNGEDILATPKPFQNGFDIRRYESYPRVKLGTATDTKINK